MEVVSVAGEGNTQPKSVENSNAFKGKRKIMIIVVVLSISLSSVFYLWSSSNTAITVNVMSITIDVYMYGNNLSLPIMTILIPYNHETLYGGSIFTVRFDLTNDYSNNLTLLSNYSITSGFAIKSISPTPPLVLGRDKTSYFQIEIISPDHNYVGNIDISLYTDESY